MQWNLLTTVTMTDQSKCPLCTEGQVDYCPTVAVIDRLVVLNISI